MIKENIKQIFNVQTNFNNYIPIVVYNYGAKSYSLGEKISF
jgi:hypothetical protein